MALPKVDAVVIGAGAGGGVVARELAVAGGLRVELLERGRWVTEAENRKDDLRNQRTTILGNAFGPEEDGNPRVLVDARGNPRIVNPSEGGYANNAACVGGGTTSYGAMAWRFHPRDFRMKSTYGCPEGSTLEDWPLSYDDLEPFYERAEYEIGVSGDVTGNPFQGARKKPLPMPPLPPSREHQMLEKAAKQLGWHPFSIPMLRNTIPYNGRQPCMRCRWCVGFACEVDAKCGTQNTVIPEALATGLCQLRTETMVQRVIVNYFDREGRLQEQPADLVVVCAGATESARLLLNSQSKLFPNGLGNRHDWVGRNLQGHTYTGAMGIFEQEIYDDLGPGASIAIGDFSHGTAGLRGGAVLCNEFIRLPIQAVPVLAPGVKRWGQGHKDFMRSYYKRTVAVQGPTQEMPVWDARVSIDPKVRDKWGIPVLRLSGGKHKHSIEVGDAMSIRAEQWLQAAGAVKTWRKRAGPGLSGGQHQAGTCRMSNDAKTGVVDRYCRVHDTSNVYVVDGSVHVTNGGYNPVLTILALGYWAGSEMVRQRRGGGGVQ
jgi:choline dehydrogenase-like flavoprotein